MLMTCNCVDYVYNCSPCKHIFACVRFFCSKQNLTVPSHLIDDWRVYLQMVYLYLWDSKGWFKWCNDMNKQHPPNYPRAGRPVRQYTKSKPSKPTAMNHQNLLHHLETLQANPVTVAAKEVVLNTEQFIIDKNVNDSDDNCEGINENTCFCESVIYIAD